MTSTDSPRGCVLLYLIFILNTDQLWTWQPPSWSCIWAKPWWWWWPSPEERDFAAALSKAIHWLQVETVMEYKYLGTTIWCSPTLRRCWRKASRQCTSRGNLSPSLSTTKSSWSSTVYVHQLRHSLLKVCWFHSVCLQGKNHLHSIFRVYSKINLHPTGCLTTVHEQKVCGMAAQLMFFPQHPRGSRPATGYSVQPVGPGGEPLHLTFSSSLCSFNCPQE